MQLEVVEVFWRVGKSIGRSAGKGRVRVERGAGTRTRDSELDGRTWSSLVSDGDERRESVGRWKVEGKTSRRNGVAQDAAGEMEVELDLIRPGQGVQGLRRCVLRLRSTGTKPQRATAGGKLVFSAPGMQNERRVRCTFVFALHGEDGATVGGEGFCGQ